MGNRDVGLTMVAPHWCWPITLFDTISEFLLRDYSSAASPTNQRRCFQWREPPKFMLADMQHTLKGVHSTPTTDQMILIYNDDGDARNLHSSRRNAKDVKSYRLSSSAAPLPVAVTEFGVQTAE